MGTQSWPLWLASGRSVLPSRKFVSCPHVSTLRWVVPIQLQPLLQPRQKKGNSGANVTLLTGLLPRLPAGKLDDLDIAKGIKHLRCIKSTVMLGGMPVVFKVDEGHRARGAVEENVVLTRVL